MRRLLIGLVLGALAVPGAALAGGWATAGLAPPPESVGPGDTWNAQITVLQHGQTPLDGVVPTVTIRSGSDTRTFTAEPAGQPGKYVAQVVFPSARELELRGLRRLHAVRRGDDPYVRSRLDRNRRR